MAEWMDPSADDLDGYQNATVHPDGTVVRLSIRRTDEDAYPSGWWYPFNYGALIPGPDTLDDGPIRRYLENRRFSATRRNGDAVSRRQRP